MAKKSHVRTLIGIQHVKGSKKLLKSEQKCFCLFFSSLKWKNYVLVLSEITRLLTY